MIIFRRWLGRLGNNIIQLENLIKIAIFYKHQINFENNTTYHPFFNTKIIEEYFINNNNDELLADCNHFYYPNRLKKIPSEVFNKNDEETYNLLKKAFVIKNEDINKLDENNIVIHIRSGDVFAINPHPKYVPPPLSYYVNILDKYKYDIIIIVCEDKINPIVNELLKLYPNSIHNINSLKDDVKIILGATNIIQSVGTFVNSLAKLSSNIKKIYSPELYKKELEKYYLINEPWRNTETQREIILNYKFE